MNDIKEKIAEIITNSLTKGFEVSEVGNVEYMYGSSPSETEFTATIKSKSDSDFVGYIWIDFQDGFQNEANVEFCKNLLINFQEVFIEGKDIINKMKHCSYDLVFMYAYCFGNLNSLSNINDINSFIQCYQYDGYHYRFNIEIKESNILINSELNLKTDKVMLHIEVITNTEETRCITISNDIQDKERLKRILLKQFAANPLNKELEELKLDDYKLLHMINY